MTNKLKKMRRKQSFARSDNDSESINTGDNEIELASAEELVSSISVVDADIENRLPAYSLSARTPKTMPVLRTVTKIRSVVQLAMVVLAWFSSGKLLADSDHSESYYSSMPASGSIFQRRLLNASDDSAINRTKQHHVEAKQLKDHMDTSVKENRNIQTQRREKQQLADRVSSASESRKDVDRDGMRSDEKDHATKHQHSSNSQWSKIDFLIAWMRRSAADKQNGKTQLLKDDVDLNFWSGTALVTVLLCCGACQLGCVIMCSYRDFFFRQQPYGFLDDFQGVSFLELCGYIIKDKGYGTVDETSFASYLPLLRREARLMMLLPLIPLVCLPWTTCEDGTPTIAYLIYVPFLIRARAIECQLLFEQGAKWTMFAYMILFSTFEQTDWFTDGSFPTQAYVCDDMMTPGLVHSLKASRFQFLAGVVSNLRFYGLATILFASAALSQQAMASYTDDTISPALAADTAGYLAMAEICHTKAGVPKEIEAGFSPPRLFTCASKVLVENCFQLRLQGSGFGLTFLKTTRWSKAKALLSLGLSAGSAMSKVISAGVTIFRGWRKGLLGDDHGCLTLIFVLICVVAPSSIVAWTMAQIYFAFICPDHLWNLSSGCVNIE